MAYIAITCLRSTVQQSMQVTGCNLQSFYEKLESLIAIMEKPYNIKGDVVALASLEAQIAEIACRAEDEVDSKSIEVLHAKTNSLRGKAFWKLCCFPEQAIEHIVGQNGKMGFYVVADKVEKMESTLQISPSNLMHLKEVSLFFSGWAHADKFFA
ncbi:hypothetical protein FXO38_30983 [Capsicum annuum]|nr:hypothetical protein FXO38_30983 [Capsicum annuum]